MNNILNFFPYRNFRQFQKETIEEIQEYFESNYEYVILESPTGSGKSAIAICLGLYNSPAYLLTSQKILQEQYINDYESPQVKVLKGRSNYQCLTVRDATCSEGICLAGKKCFMREDCPYNSAKSQALNAKIALMNYTYFLNVVEYTTNFSQRKLLICDECHNLETECLKFIEFSFSSFNLDRLGVTSQIPVYNEIHDYVDWVENLLGKTKDLLGPLDEEIKNTSNHERLMELQKERDQLETQKEKMQKFLSSYESTEWLFDITESEKLKRKSISFKPLTVSYFTKDLLFNNGEKKFLMSATVLDKENYCKTVGIDPGKTKFIQLPSMFPLDGRPIIITNTGNMGKNYLDKTLPKIADDISKMLDYHHDEKGLIHTHTYKISNYLKNNMDSKFQKRFVFHGSDDREDKLEEFINSSEPKVLVSPSMTEGLDLRDDLARFVVIVKIPYLFLGDKQIKRRLDLDQEWYRWRTALTLVQAAGRGVRHEEDYCTIYIMDSSIKYFIKSNLKFFPKYFLDSIKN